MGLLVLLSVDPLALRGRLFSSFCTEPLSTLTLVDLWEELFLKVGRFSVKFIVERLGVLASISYLTKKFELRRRLISRERF